MLLQSFIFKASENSDKLHLPFPAVWIAVFVMVLFLCLAAVSWSYRNVANRHSDKVLRKSVNQASEISPGGH